MIWNNINVSCKIKSYNQLAIYLEADTTFIISSIKPIETKLLWVISNVILCIHISPRPSLTLSPMNIKQNRICRPIKGSSWPILWDNYAKQNSGCKRR